VQYPIDLFPLARCPDELNRHSRLFSFPSWLPMASFDLHALHCHTLPPLRGNFLKR
jgi:hypothetical protein